jgi:parvulin-like peptidyl-prolyl isomerase
VSVPGDGKTVNVGLDEDARNKIAQIRQRALSGESFEKLASDLSDAPSKANAGLIGPLNLSELSPDLRKLIESMKPGQISEILRTPRGYQLLKLETSTAPETMPFEQAKDQISDRVFTDKRREEYDRFLERLRGQAIIEWKNDELKRAYERGLGESKKQGGNPAARG